jgi:branched-chain amino acid transport system permease protein
LVGGGLVSFWGPVVGVIVFLIARDVIGAVTNAWMLYFGTMFVLLVLFQPEGIAGAARMLKERWKRRTTAPARLSSAQGSG